MQTIDDASRVQIQRRRDSGRDPLHGSAGPVIRRRGRGEQTHRERRSRGALACELRQLVADERARRRSRGQSAAVLQREAAMLALAKRLDSDAPVAPDGVDRVRALVADSRRRAFSAETSPLAEIATPALLGKPTRGRTPNLFITSCPFAGQLL